PAAARAGDALPPREALFPGRGRRRVTMAERERKTAENFSGANDADPREERLRALYAAAYPPAHPPARPSDTLRRRVAEVTAGAGGRGRGSGVRGRGAGVGGTVAALVCFLSRRPSQGFALAVMVPLLIVALAITLAWRHSMGAKQISTPS